MRRTICVLSLSLGEILATVTLLVGSLFAQSVIEIHDSAGNQATAALYGQNLYFHDAKGNFATGAVNNGRVFLTVSNGETIFGTIKNGSVFLVDKQGITTGSIRDGNIFLNGSDGSISSGRYDNQGNMYITTTSPPEVPASSTDPKLQQRIEERRGQDYEAGYAIGYGLGAAIGAAIDRHKLHSFCNANPTQTFQANDGTKTPCQEAPLPETVQKSLDRFCPTHPMAKIQYGLRTVYCDTIPDAPNLYWATYLLDTGARAYQIFKKKKDVQGMKDATDAFNQGKYGYCLLTGKGAAYKDWDGNEQHCQ